MNRYLETGHEAPGRPRPGSPEYWRLIDERAREARRLRAETAGAWFARVRRSVPSALLGLFLSLPVLVLPVLTWAGETAPAPALVAAARSPGAGDAQSMNVREINRLLAQGEELERAGHLSEAIQPWSQARELAVRSDAQSLVMLLNFRIGSAERRLYENSGDPERIKSAIRHWEEERVLYETHRYPPAFRGLVLYDLADAYLALAAREDVNANMARAAQALEDAQSLITGDVTARVQHILAARQVAAK
jgi:hypothetical protein